MPGVDGELPKRLRVGREQLMEVLDARDATPRKLLDGNPFASHRVHLIASRDYRLARLRNRSRVEHALQDAPIESFAAALVWRVPLDLSNVRY